MNPEPIIYLNDDIWHYILTLLGYESKIILLHVSKSICNTFKKSTDKCYIRTFIKFCCKAGYMNLLEWSKDIHYSGTLLRSNIDIYRDAIASNNILILKWLRDNNYGLLSQIEETSELKLIVWNYLCENFLTSVQLLKHCDH